ncbi:MAG TPA: hypothetical protein VG015_07885 [Candidatus Dormibacteraeota bacterium]|jgi:hypothetical protein|nr:hypothetical protein [Candidatus Dormibacteraeota bacterium]
MSKRRLVVIEGRTIGAGAIAAAAGLTVLGIFLFAGLTLYDRLWAASTSILIAVYLACAVIGGYAGWILALVVFGSIRGGPGESG